MFLQRFPNRLTRQIMQLAFALPTTILTTAASACFVEPGHASSVLNNNYASATSLGQTILEQRLDDFPLLDRSGKEASIGRMVYGVSREEAGTLNFFNRFVNYTPDNIAIDMLSISGFEGVTAEIRTIKDDEHQLLPLSANRSADGMAIDFDFDETPLEPGSKSLTLMVRTGATEYDQSGLISLQASGANHLSQASAYQFEDAHLRSFAPAKAPMTVPLPAPIWTSLAGLAATVVYVLRHKHVF